MNNDDTITVIKVLKRSKYYYLSFSNGEEVKVDPEIYFKYNLIEKTEFSQSIYSEVITENSFRLGMNTALRLLSQRMHSTYEIKLLRFICYLLIGFLF